MTPDAPVTADARWNHWTLLTLSAVVLAASLLLECTEEGQVRVPLAGVEVPGLCWWRRWTGLDCPGCGLTRCFVSLAHGHPAAAMGYHPLGVVLFVLVVAQLPYRGIQLARLARGRAPWSHPLLKGGLWLLFAALVVQWLLSLFGLLPF